MKPLQSRVDAHCHVDLLEDWQVAIRRLEARAQFTFAVTTTPKAWAVEREAARECRYVKIGAGLHPQVVRDRMAELPLLERAIVEAPFVGEVGLDGSASHKGSLPEQQKVLDRVFSLCSELGGRVLSLHSLRAVGLVLDLAEKTRVYERNTLIFHWFTGTSSELKRAMAMGGLISVNADMLRTEKGRLHAKAAGMQRTLTESDSPFTKAHPVVDGLPDVEPAVAALATCWEVETPVVLDHVERLAQTLWTSGAGQNKLRDTGRS